ncbi:MAG: TIGR01458 family HAD-type hydrolase, partial [Actinobacteria bacterium]|nr:TIGR01458 family HAD-type hydrolase [Actinomycetota bacterium]
MTAILLDVDGVLHVSGEPIAGAADAVARLRAAGHRLRFVSNTTTRSRATLARELRELGIELVD